MAYIIITTAIFSYLIGNIMSAIIFSKKMANVDVTKEGSKNAGTTNAIRTAGVKVGIVTFLSDLLKGSIAVIVAWVISIFTKTNVSLLCSVAGISVVLGHTFPVIFGFKGGKGVATAIGVMLVISPLITAILFFVGIVIVLATRMVSVASIAASCAFPVLLFLLHFSILGYAKGEHSLLIYTIFGILMSLILIFNHRSNIKRLAKGEENKLTFKKTSGE